MKTTTKTRHAGPIRPGKQITFNYDAEFASQVMDSIPPGYIDKQVCGCGLTTVALENGDDTVIAVPTIHLALNKAEQYPNKRCVFEILAVWGDVTDVDIWDYIASCRKKGHPVKIITTYDGLKKVEHLLHSCKLVIDESDSLLALTKGDRRDAIYHLFKIAERYKESVSFVSATPISLKYLPEWISGINQVRMNWSNTMKARPIIAERTYPFKSLREEFIKPIKENGELTVAGKTFKKVIVFVNSVTTIGRIIKEAKLDRNECGVIAGDTLRNSNVLRGVERYTTGEQPTFLFITSSGFSGIDLYDDSAMSIVVSNTNKEFTMVDLLTDLKQAVSRNRDKTNPNYGYYIYIYNQSVFSTAREKLLTDLENWQKSLSRDVEYINSKIRFGEVYSLTREQREYFIMGDDGMYQLNYNAFMADKYFILETRDQYTKGFNIQGVVGQSEVIEPVELPKDTSYEDLVAFFRENHVDGNIDWGIYGTRTEWITVIEALYKLTGNLDSNYTRAKEALDAYGDDWKVTKMEIRRIFKKGHKYSRKEITGMLQRYYDSHDIERKAKYSDLYEVFEKSKLRNTATKGVRGIEIL